MGTRMLQRRGDAAEWAAVNPVLGDGEIGFERDTGEIRIGDGVTAWDDLVAQFSKRGGVVNGDLIVANPHRIEGKYLVGPGNLGPYIDMPTSDVGDVTVFARGTGNLVVNPKTYFKGVTEFHGANAGVKLYSRDDDTVDYEWYVNGNIARLWSSFAARDLVTVDSNGHLVTPGSVRVPSSTNPAVWASLVPTGIDLAYGAAVVDSATIVMLKGAPVTTTTPSQVPLIVKGAASQTADLQQWQDSAGTVLAYISATGVLKADTVKASSQIRSTYELLAGDNLIGGSSSFGAALNAQTWGTAVKGAVIRGVAGQTANLQEWQNNAGGILAEIDPVGHCTFTYGKIGVPGTTFPDIAMLEVVPDAATTVGEIIRGYAGQTGDLAQWQNNVGTVLAKITKDGYIYEGANRVYSAANPPPGGGGSSINQTIRGTISITGTSFSANATIASVVMAKTQLRYLGDSGGYWSSNNSQQTSNAYIVLTNSTTITATRGAAGSVGTTVTVSYDLTEWV